MPNYHIYLSRQSQSLLCTHLSFVIIAITATINIIGKDFTDNWFLLLSSDVSWMACCDYAIIVLFTCTIAIIMINIIDIIAVRIRNKY